MKTHSTEVESSLVAEHDDSDARLVRADVEREDEAQQEGTDVGPVVGADVGVDARRLVDDEDDVDRTRNDVCA